MEPNMKNFNTILAVGAVAAVCGAAEAAVVPFTGTFTFPSVSPGTAPAPAPFAYNGTPIQDVTVGAMAISPSVTSTGSNGNFRASGWALDGATVGSLTGQIDLSKYITFTITANAGFTIDMSTITFGLGRSATGVRQWQWRSSVDNFSAALSNYTSLNVGLTNTNGVLQNPDSNSNWTGNTLTVSGSAFSGLTSIEFRLYGYNSEGTAGTGGLQGPLSFTGSVTAVPAPGAMALLGVAGLLGARRRR
jgi:MYXO-CTERM domain-containing protein